MLLAAVAQGAICDKCGVENLLWATPTLAGDAIIAWHPVLVLILLAIVPIAIKARLFVRRGLSGTPYWFYPVDLGFLPVACSGFDVLGVRTCPPNSWIGENWTFAFVCFFFFFAVWIMALVMAVAATPRADGSHSLPLDERKLFVLVLNGGMLALMLFFCVVSFGGPVTGA